PPLVVPSVVVPPVVEPVVPPVVVPPVVVPVVVPPVLVGVPPLVWPPWVWPPLVCPWVWPWLPWPPVAVGVPPLPWPPVPGAVGWGGAWVWSAPAWSWRSKSADGCPFSAALVYCAQIWAGGPPPLTRGRPIAPYSDLCAAVTGSW